jgi:hypothetical protein
MVAIENILLRIQAHAPPMVATERTTNPNFRLARISANSNAAPLGDIEY